MQCPFCGANDDKVVDSRSSEGGLAVRRRRQCLRCRRRFTTYERVEETARITVVKKDGSRMPYDRERVLAGLRKACYKRPVSGEQLRQIAEATEEAVFAQFEREVPSSFIGDTVSRLLRQTDQVAYIRFASVYRQFQDVGEFIEEAEGIRGAPPAGREQGRLFQEKQRQDSPETE